MAYEFASHGEMEGVLSGQIAGRHVYARQLCPASEALAVAIAAMEGAQAAHVFGSGMAAISAVVLQLVEAGSEIVASRSSTRPICRTWRL